MKNDPLDEIYVRPEQVEGENRALLAKMIVPFAYIVPDTGKIYFRAPADDLNSKQKILVYLLCRLALSTREGSEFPASVSPKEVEIELGIPGGTVRPKLAQLADEKIAIRKGEGYMISSDTLKRAYAELEQMISKV